MLCGLEVRSRPKLHCPRAIFFVKALPPWEEGNLAAFSLVSHCGGPRGHQGPWESGQILLEGEGRGSLRNPTEPFIS